MAHLSKSIINRDIEFYAGEVERLLVARRQRPAPDDDGYLRSAYAVAGVINALGVYRTALDNAGIQFTTDGQ